MGLLGSITKVFDSTVTYKSFLLGNAIPEVVLRTADLLRFT